MAPVYDEQKDHAAIAADCLRAADKAHDAEAEQLWLGHALVHAVLSVAEQVNGLTFGPSNQ